MVGKHRKTAGGRTIKASEFKAHCRISTPTPQTA